MYHLNHLIIPPTEIHSLKVNLTTGCRNKNCTFCPVDEKSDFTVCSSNQVIEQIDAAIEKNGTYRNAFLLYEDAISLPDGYIIEALDYLKKVNPFLTRISIMAETSLILEKGTKRLNLLKTHGLTRVYQNIISGSNEILSDMNMTSTNEDQLMAAYFIKEAGLELAQTIALGTAAKDDLQMNAFITAKHLSNMSPDYINAVDVTHKVRTGLNSELKSDHDAVPDILDEMITIIENLELKKTVFTSSAENNDLCLYIRFPEQKFYMLALLEDLKKNTAHTAHPYASNFM
ncbi:MAG: radical SAM protein [Spirochaetes bacterium]|nr:radical SAM protein [Spirochaetota bacterium]